MGVLSYACWGCLRLWPVTRDTAAGALSHTSHQEFMAVTVSFSLEPTVLHPGRCLPRFQ